MQEKQVKYNTIWLVCLTVAFIIFIVYIDSQDEMINDRVNKIQRGLGDKTVEKVDVSGYVTREEFESRLRGNVTAKR